MPKTADRRDHPALNKTPKPKCSLFLPNTFLSLFVEIIIFILTKIIMKFSHLATKKLVDESTSTEVAIRRTTKRVDKEALIAQRLLETKKKTMNKFDTTPLGPHDYVPFPGDDDVPSTRVKEEKGKTKESDMTYKYYVRDLGIGNATELAAWIDKLAELLLFIAEGREKLPEMSWSSASSQELFKVKREPGPSRLWRTQNLRARPTLIRA